MYFIIGTIMIIMGLFIIIESQSRLLIIVSKEEEKKTKDFITKDHLILKQKKVGENHIILICTRIRGIRDAFIYLFCFHYKYLLFSYNTYITTNELNYKRFTNLLKKNKIYRIKEITSPKEDS